MDQALKVAIVGAGAAGLCALRHLTSSASPVRLTAIAFEQAPRVGGTWLYTDSIGTDEFGLPVHSSMYKNLRTNLPKECMAFPDFSFPSALPSFVQHEDVQNYLEAYASHFDVLKHIQFQTRVQQIKPVYDEASEFKVKWKVTTLDVRVPDTETTDIFDAVLVCNGHYSIPLLPDIPGLETFTGEVIHSHNYRNPEPYQGKIVVVLGANSSGQDIGLELAPSAHQVILSHNKPPLTSSLPGNLQQRTGIQSVNGDMIQFMDDSIVRADVIFLCTGYRFDFSFLATECGVKVEEQRVTPLYKHVVHTKYPSLGIIGICNVIVPFPMFDVQVRFFRAILDGTLSLPSEAEMNLDTEMDYQRRRSEGMPHRYAHRMGDRQFAYNHELADMAQTTRIADCVEKLYRLSHTLRAGSLMTYKNVNFNLKEIENDNSIVISS